MLSNQAMPNTLSTSTTPAKAGTSPAAPVRPTVRPASASSGSAQQDPRIERPAERKRRLPSFGTVLFIGFILYTASRWLNGVDFGDPGSTTAPRPTPAVVPASPRPTPTNGPHATQGAVGVVTFGVSRDDDCVLAGESGRFLNKAGVWWRAELDEVQPQDADVLVFTFRNGDQVDREFVPAEPEYGEWSILCSTGPTKGALAGTYRVEVWNGDKSVLLATGEFIRQ